MRVNDAAAFKNVNPLLKTLTNQPTPTSVDLHLPNPAPICAPTTPNPRNARTITPGPDLALAQLANSSGADSNDHGASPD